MTSTFWGLRLEPGKRYSTTVDKSFHVSMAALDCNTVKNEKDIHCVMLEEGESNIPFILCNLQKPKVLQSRLNLNFESGDRVTFFCRGSGTVHLTGYIMPEEDDLAQFGEDGEEVEEEEEEVDDDEEDEDEDEEKEVTGKIAKINGKPEKRKGESATGQPAKKKKQALKQDSDMDSEEDDEMDEEGEDESADSDEEGVEQADSDEASDEEEEASSPVVTEQISKKKKKNNPALNVPQQNSQQQLQQQKKETQHEGKNEKPRGKKVEGGLFQETQQEGKNEKPKGKKVEGGVIVHDTKVGNGALCKPGKIATVYYTGRLKSNNKVFDSTTQGPGFKFRVGRGEVIKGWDVGLSGMKVGGKRLITCPPNMGYGQKGMPPTIPGNASLVFEVELKSVQ